MEGCGPPRAHRTTGLRRGTADVLGSGALGTLANLELHAVALPQIGNPFTRNGALVKEVVLPLFVLDEPESLVHSQRTNCSGQAALLRLLPHVTRGTSDHFKHAPRIIRGCRSISVCQLVFSSRPAPSNARIVR